MKYSKQPSYNKHKLSDSPIYNLSVRIIALDKNKSNVIASGTGVVIAKHLILTAKHVIEDFISKLGTPTISENSSVDFNIWIVFISNTQSELYNGFETAKIYFNPYSDLALLHLDPVDKLGNKTNWHQPKLKLTLPTIGERITAFGFTKSRTSIEIGENGIKNISVDDEPRVSVGEIIDIYPEKRDNYLMPFPSFRINAKLEGGMSGGPVFNDNGNLIGVVCSSYDQIESSQEHISYVSLLWPLMGTIVTDNFGSEKPLYLYAKNKIVYTEGLSKVTISRNTSGNYNISLSKK